MSEPLILAFDTSAAHCAVALLCGDEILETRTEELHKGQAERLIPLIEEVLDKAGKTWPDLTAIGVGIGPGNFTGIRLSVSAARGLALSLDIPAVGVSVFEAMAEGQDAPVIACVDARRQQIYVQALNIAEPTAPKMIETDDLEAYLDRPEHRAFCTLGTFSTSKCTLSPPLHPQPVAIAIIAARKFAGNPPRPAPLYIRSADAAPSSEAAPLILS